LLYGVITPGKKRVIGAAGGMLLGLFLNLLGIIIIYCTNKVDNEAFLKYKGLSAADEIKKYKDLLDSGAITQAEYSRQKARILNQ